jgi:hypothetical protein
MSLDTLPAAPSSRASRPRAPRMQHLPFLVALAAGVAIRIVVMVAYRPALLFFDSAGYLARAEEGGMGDARPVGYSLVIAPLRHLFPSTLVPVTLFQHLLGLGLAVACYVFLVRRGLPGWGATLATLPLLLDPLQLVLEHYVLSDVVFEVLLVGACLLVLWKPRPGPWLLVASGLATGASALVRGAGSLVVVVLVIAVVCLRLGWRRVTAFVVAALAPLAIYATVYHHVYGQFALSSAGPRFLYARVAPIVACHNPQLDLPSYERMLCPKNPVGQRASSDYFMWGGHRGPAYQLVPPPGMTTEQVLKDFAKRVIRTQPRAFTRITLDDFVHGFAPTRTTQVRGFPAKYWLFRDHYWMRHLRGWKPTADPGPAAFLQRYRETLWTPGPLLGGLLVLSAVATLGFGRSRRSGDRVAIGLLAGACTITLLTGAAVSGFSWRYQLPQLGLLPLAGALAIAALVRGRAPGRPPAAPPLNLLDRASGALVVRRPGLASAHERGVLPLLLAALCGLVAAVLVTVGAVGSGWFRAGPGGVVGIGAGVATFVVLAVAHRRARRDLASGRQPSTPAPDPTG